MKSASAEAAASSDRTPPDQGPLVWGLIDDRPGHATQVRGVADALPWPVVEKPMAFAWLARLDPRLLGASAVGLTRACRVTLQPPWPDLLLTCGRRCLPVARWIKRRSGGRTRIVHLMRPASTTDLDLIVLPRHDRDLPAGVEVLRVTGAPHRVGPARLADARQAFAARYAPLPAPRIGLLVGGPSRHVPYADGWSAELGRAVSVLARERGGSVIATTSRRTGVAATAALAAALDGPHDLWSPGDPSDNPYLGILAWADALVVTVDSVSMLSEACATAKPVHLFGADRVTGRKVLALVEQLRREGRLVALGEPFDHAPPAPLDPAAEVADVIEKRALEWLGTPGRDSSGRKRLT